MDQADSAWVIPPTFPPLPPADVHVWRLDLDRPSAEQENLTRVLSPDERERAARYRFEIDQRRFATGRGALRSLLSRYLNAAPAELHFEVNQAGKPSLPPQADGRCLHFNLSNSHGLALLAFTWDRRVGVDVEFLGRSADFEQISARFFSPGERDALLRLPADQRRAAFFAAWTRKEAYLKALGTGIALGLDRFDVSLDPGEPARLLKDEHDPSAPENWAFQALYPGENYAAALAVEGRGWNLALWQWPG